MLMMILLVLVGVVVGCVIITCVVVLWVFRKTLRILLLVIKNIKFCFVFFTTENKNNKDFS